MIEINLLPEGLRKYKRRFQIPEITLSFIPILIGVMALLISIHVVLILTVKIKNNAYRKMEREWEEIKPQKEVVAITQKDSLKTKQELDAIEVLITKKILWSKKLNQLSDLIIPGVWFTKLSIEKKIVTAKPKVEGAGPLGIKKATLEKIEIPYFNIEGEVSSVYGEELALIGKFIEQLKSDPGFFKDFSNIELGSTQLYSRKDSEVMKFNISCYFKKINRD